MLALTFFAALVAPVAGEVRSYVRSDIDGSFAERITIYDRAPEEVWVHKARSRCSPSAFVVGKLDPETGQALLLTGGRLGRDLTQQPMAWLERGEDGVMRVSLGSGNSEPVLEVPTADRWVLFDFDFSDLIAHPPSEIAQRENLSFDLPLLLVGDGEPTLENLGRLSLVYETDEVHEGRNSIRYKAVAPSNKGGDGQFWFGMDGRLLEARMPIPNHSEHKDFRIRLVETGIGEAQWKKTLAAHWEGCDSPE